MKKKPDTDAYHARISGFFFKLIRASIDIYQKIKPATELIKLSDNIVLV